MFGGFVRSVKYLYDVVVSGGSLNNVTIGATTPGAVYNVAQVTTHAASENVTAASMYGNYHRITGAYTVTLPAAVVGMHASFRATSAAIFSIDCQGADSFSLGGTTLAAGNKITSDGNSGARVELSCDVANLWVVKNITGVVIDGGA